MKSLLDSRKCRKRRRTRKTVMTRECLRYLTITNIQAASYFQRRTCMHMCALHAFPEWPVKDSPSDRSRFLRSPFISFSTCSAAPLVPLWCTSSVLLPGKILSSFPAFLPLLHVFSRDCLIPKHLLHSWNVALLSANPQIAFSLAIVEWVGDYNPSLNRPSLTSKEIEELNKKEHIALE